MCRLVGLLLLLVVALVQGCQSSPRVYEAPRFTDVHQILMRTDSSVVQLPMADGRPMTPHFPFTEQLRRKEAFPIIAYIIGADGRIEPGTVTFLVSVAGSFAASLCDWATRARFTVVRDSTGAIRRSLAVQAFSFEIDDGKRQPPPDSKTKWHQLQTLGAESAFAYLETLPHCGLLK